MKSGNAPILVRVSNTANSWSHVNYVRSLARGLVTKGAAVWPKRPARYYLVLVMPGLSLGPLVVSTGVWRDSACAKRYLWLFSSA